VKRKLIHYSKNPLTAVDPNWPPAVRFGKPPGLWVSVEAGGDDGWRDWCVGENFELDRLTHATEIVLKPDPKPLWIQSKETLRLFTTEFMHRKGKSGYFDIDNPTAYRSDYDWIDWDRVMAKWPALIIAPYQWESRLDTDLMWYYLWDCASGVIWDTSIIADLKPAPKFARAADEATP
jgi:hypothetical protein